MRVALVGWDIDDAIAGALAGLGAEVVSFTRWHENEPLTQDMHGWTKERCPHSLGGGPTHEAISLRDAIVARCAKGGGLAPVFDAVHALDPPAMMAASALATHGSQTVLAASFPGPGPDTSTRIDLGVFEHPILADELSSTGSSPARMVVAPTAKSLLSHVPSRPRDAHRVCIWVTRQGVIEPANVIAALQRVRAVVPDAAALVLGSGPAAVRLGNRLEAERLGSYSGPRAIETEPEHWTTAVGTSSAFVCVGPPRFREPAGRLAWALGTPAVSPGPDLPESLLHLFQAPDRTERLVAAGRALALRQLGPEGVAQTWLTAYVETASSVKEERPPAFSAAVPVLPWTRRSRIEIWPVGPREALVAWHVRSDDWNTAIERLGALGSRAALTVRFEDITDLEFRGDNAHATWYLTLGYGEESRLIPLNDPGRSLAVTLGVGVPNGPFVPLAHAPLVHLPREAETLHPGTRSLTVMPRR